MVAALALEIEHRVDHVLDHARTGDLAVLGDVADKDDGRAARLGVADKRLGGGAHLGNGSGRALHDLGPQRLDGIDHHEVNRRSGRKRGEDVLDLRLGGERYRRITQAEPFGAEPNLADRLFARHVDDASAGIRHRSGDLDQDGRLADAGIAADQDRRARDEAAADDTVELADTGERARQLLGVAGERGKRDWLAASGAKRGRHGGRRFLGKRVPFAARFAAPLPFGGHRAAIGADELRAGGASHQADAGGFRYRRSARRLRPVRSS